MHFATHYRVATSKRWSGNWLIQAQIMLYDEPSRGIDVSAKQQFLKLCGRSAEGRRCRFVSTELEELLEVCHGS